MLRRKSLKASNNTEQTVSKQDRKRKRREAPQGVTLEQAVLGKSVNLLVEGRSEEHSKVAEKTVEQAVWNDDDDTELRVDVSSTARLRKLRKNETESDLTGEDYSKRLRTQFEKIHGRPAWADKERNDDDTEPGILALSRNLIAKSIKKLPTKRLEVLRVRDANVMGPSQATVNSVQFHPTAPALFTVGMDKKLRIFQIDEEKNPMLQSVHFDDLPIISAGFMNQGNEIILSGRRKYFYSYDLQEGKVRKIHELQGRKEKSLEKMFISPDSKYIVFTGYDGSLVLASGKTKQNVGCLKMSGSVNTVCFHKDGNQMITAGSLGKIHIWDLRMRKCMHAFTDEGSTSTTAVTIFSQTGAVACGSTNGVVNLYDSSCFREEFPKPQKAFMNLTTNIRNVSFHPSGQMMVMYSRVKKDALRMVHTSSMSVFENWPTSGSPLNYVNCVDFSPSGGYLAVGNDKGKALLYRLSHYSQL
eukprot:m.198855 g.198855  ORF g.198855 m.198855 type:complete len:472 (+) comp15721_c0_seq2:160-1575(+)